MDHFEKHKVPATIYLYGLGVISNERSENFNFPQNRPDLIICSGAIKPKVLIDIKYQEFTNHKNKYFPELIRRVTKGENELLLCNVDNYEEYLKESEKVNCPIYIAKVIKLINDKKSSYHFLGLELSRGLENSLSIITKGHPKKEAYAINYEKMLHNEQFFDKLLTLFR